MIERPCITPLEATNILSKEEKLIGFYITGTIELSKLISAGKRLWIENCFIENLKGEAIQSLIHPIVLESSEFKSCTFSFAYFNAGLIINNCIFSDYLDFQCGGHNRSSHIVSITNSTFKGFVNFFDCIYNGPVEILNNDFRNGTNLLGNKDYSYKVQFDMKPLIQDNQGIMNLDGEGGLRINLVDRT